MFDSIIAETDERFNLNGKAEALLSALSARMTDETRGGLTGFIEKFNQIGLSETISSWVGSDSNSEISVEQIESALGTAALNDLANQSGVDYETAIAAAAFMIPRVIDELTPEGILPENKDLHSRHSGFTTNINTVTNLTAEETFDRVGAAAVSALETDKRKADVANMVDESVANPVIDKVNADVNAVNTNLDSGTGNHKGNINNSPLAWMLPLLLLGLLLILGYWFCSKTPPTTSAATTNTSTKRTVAKAA
jgi:uncharacterized protein YidB (DUF937 family)